MVWATERRANHFMKTTEKKYNNTSEPKKFPYEDTTAYNGRRKLKFLKFTTHAHFTVRNFNYRTRIIMPVIMLACTYQWAWKTVVVHAFDLSILTTVFVKIRTGLIRLYLNKNAPECFIPPDVHHVFKSNFMCKCLTFTCYWRWFWLCVT